MSTAMELVILQCHEMGHSGIGFKTGNIFEEHNKYIISNLSYSLQGTWGSVMNISAMFYSL